MKLAPINDTIVSAGQALLFASSLLIGFLTPVVGRAGDIKTVASPISSTTCQQPGSIPFEIDWRMRVFIPATVNDKHVTALVDTGAARSNINKSFLNALDPAETDGRVARGAYTVRGTGGEVSGLDGYRAQIHVGNLTIPEKYLPAPDFSEAERAMSRSFDLILGLDLFAVAPITFDFSRKCITFDDLSQNVSAATYRLPLLKRSGLILVSLNVAGTGSALYNVDLGFDGALSISKDFYEKSLRSGHKPCFTKRGQGISNGFNFQICRVDKVGIGRDLFNNVPAIIYPDPAGTLADGMVGSIGTDFLSRFKVSIDYHAGVMFLTPMSDAASRPYSIDRLGLNITAGSDKLIVIDVDGGSPAQKAGLHRGDLISAINGVPINENSSRQLAEIRLAPVGTKISFTVNGERRVVSLAEYF